MLSLKKQMDLLRVDELHHISVLVYFNSNLFTKTE